MTREVALVAATRDLAGVGAEYAREFIRPRAVRMAHGDAVHFPREVLTEAAARGLAGLLVPRAYGGSEAGHVAFATFIEAGAPEGASTAGIPDVHTSAPTA